MNKRMKVMLVSIIISIFYSLLAGAAPIPATGTIDVYFSPKGGATEAVVVEINKAKSEVLVQAYSFTSTPIAKALLLAHKRGVNETICWSAQNENKQKIGSSALVD